MTRLASSLLVLSGLVLAASLGVVAVVYAPALPHARAWADYRLELLGQP